MESVKKELRTYLNYLMTSGSTPTILPELIQLYDELDSRYPDSKPTAIKRVETPEEAIKRLSAEMVAVLECLSTGSKVVEITIDPDISVMRTKKIKTAGLPETTYHVIYRRSEE